jgi:hypothetical protein
MLMPIALEHGGQFVRDSLKSRTAQRQAQLEVPAGPDRVQLIAADVDQLKEYTLQLRSDIDTLNNAVTEREEGFRRWLLALLIWNIVMTLGLVLLAVFALRH